MTQGVAVRESCPFCGRVRNALETDLANAYAIAFDDAYPVNPGHTLIVTKRHVERYGEPGRVMNIPGGPQAEPS